MQNALAHYHPRTVTHESFEANAAAAGQNDWTFSGSAARLEDAAGTGRTLILRGDGARAEKAFDLRGSEKAHFRCRWNGQDLAEDTDARLTVEVRAGDGAWQTVRTCDAATLGKRSPLKGSWHTACASLPASVQCKQVRVRFRLIGARPDTRCGIADLRIIADGADD